MVCTYKGIIVADGFDNGEYIETEYADVLAAWESRLLALEHKPSGVQTVNGVAPDGEGNVVVEVPAPVTDDHINELINNALGVIENGTY